MSLNAPDFHSEEIVFGLLEVVGSGTAEIVFLAGGVETQARFFERFAGGDIFIACAGCLGVGQLD